MKSGTPLSPTIAPVKVPQRLAGNLTVPRVRPHSAPACHRQTAPESVSGHRFTPARRDPLGRLISQLVQLAGSNAFMAESTSRPWASATFVGAQHVLTLCIGARDQGDDCAGIDAAERFARALPEAEFHIPGHIVADIVIDERLPISGRSPAMTEFRITALTIEDW